MARRGDSPHFANALHGKNKLPLMSLDFGRNGVLDTYHGRDAVNKRSRHGIGLPDHKGRASVRTRLGPRVSNENISNPAHYTEEKTTSSISSVIPGDSKCVQSSSSSGPRTYVISNSVMNSNTQEDAFDGMDYEDDESLYEKFEVGYDTPYSPDYDDHPSQEFGVKYCREIPSHEHSHPQEDSLDSDPKYFGESPRCNDSGIDGVEYDFNPICPQPYHSDVVMDRKYSVARHIDQLESQQHVFRGDDSFERGESSGLNICSKINSIQFECPVNARLQSNPLPGPKITTSLEILSAVRAKSFGSQGESEVLLNNVEIQQSSDRVEQLLKEEPAPKQKQPKRRNLNICSETNHIEDMQRRVHMDVFSRIIDKTTDPRILLRCIKTVCEIQQLLPRPGVGRITAPDKMFVYQSMRDILQFLHNSYSSLNQYQHLTVKDLNKHSVRCGDPLDRASKEDFVKDTVVKILTFLKSDEDLSNLDNINLKYDGDLKDIPYGSRWVYQLKDRDLTVDPDSVISVDHADDLLGVVEPDFELEFEDTS